MHEQLARIGIKIQFLDNELSTNLVKYGILLLLLLMGPPLNAMADHPNPASDLVVDHNGVYQIEIIAISFRYSIIDLNQVNQLLNSGYNETTARSNATLQDKKIKNLDYGRQITITAKSADILHGLMIDELGIEMSLEPPENNNSFGAPQTENSALPSVDTTIRAYCHIFCGDGHSEMYFELIVGAGSDFENDGIDVIGDWRVWLLFSLFTGASLFIVGLAVIKPKNLQEGETI